METKKHIFTKMEKKCFMDIIKKFSKIIESKDLDGSTLRNKNKAWDNIAAEFNASPHATTQATPKQLRRLWMNLKQRQREAWTKKRRYRFSSEGEPSTSDTDTTPRLANIAPAPTVAIDTAVYSKTVQEMVMKCPNILEPAIIITSAPQNSEKKCAPLAVMPTFTSTSSLPSTKTPHVSPECSKLSLVEKEHNEKQRRENEKHELELQILREQLREQKAKADLAEFILNHKMNFQHNNQHNLN